LKHYIIKTTHINCLPKMPPTGKGGGKGVWDGSLFRPAKRAIAVPLFRGGIPALPKVFECFFKIIFTLAALF
jgi:hypothetical protein